MAPSHPACPPRISQVSPKAMWQIQSKKKLHKNKKTYIKIHSTYMREERLSMNNIGLKFAFSSIAFAQVSLFACGPGGSTWEGRTNSWNTNSNWSSDVPSIRCPRGTISASPPYFPVLDVNATASLRFQGSSMLTIPTGFSYTPSPGFVALSGASPIIYVSGGTLKDILDKQLSLSLDEAMSYFVMMLLGLHYLH